MKNKFDSKKQVRIIIFFSIVLFLANFFLPDSYAHLEHASSGGIMEGKYFSYIGFEPRNPIPKEPTKIIFSIQDKKGNDLYNIQTMIEIYNTSIEKRLFVEPWIKQKVGDFEIPYTFKEQGTYQIVLSISEEVNEKQQAIVPSQTISSSLNCNCTRVLFNASVSENWGNIWNSLMVIIIVLPFSIFGYSMMLNYKNKRNSQKKLNTYETLRYIIVLLAFAGGLVHLTIYIDHAPLRIEYSIFLLLAAITQIGFGVLFFSTLLFDSNTLQKKLNSQYHKHTAINLFGLVGSVILLGLYTYVVNFPPPLSPENHPEKIELVGIIAKALEISLIGIIIYVMKWENKLKQLTTR